MKILVIVLIAALIIITTKYISYRRQIKKLCRQLLFVSENESNHRIRTDITEKEILELAQLMNEMHDRYVEREIILNNKDRRLKEALTSVSHDIRTPLTSLKGYFSLLMSENDMEKQMQYASIMNERMDNLAALLDELFTYTKLQNEDYHLELQEYDFTRIVLDAMFSFYDIMKEKNISPELDIDDNSYKVLCNDVAVKRVLSNILRNAVLHGNGTIRLQYGLVNDDKDKDITEKSVRFVCENTLAHADEVDINQIFNRFYMADKARSSNSTGLGLAISKELVERMNGRITASLIGNIFRIEVFFMSVS